MNNCAQGQAPTHLRTAKFHRKLPPNVIISMTLVEHVKVLTENFASNRELQCEAPRHAERKFPNKKHHTYNYPWCGCHRSRSNPWQAPDRMIIGNVVPARRTSPSIYLSFLRHVPQNQAPTAMPIIHLFPKTAISTTTPARASAQNRNNDLSDANRMRSICFV